MGEMTLALVALLAVPAPAPPSEAVVVLISADTEWKIVRERMPGPHQETSPLGEWFRAPVKGARHPVVFFHGGWGKIRAAASTQYVIDRWRPRLLVNLGTCGGFGGAIEKGDVVLVDKTVVYDIVEQMGDSAEAIAAYTTTLDVAWVGSDLPADVPRLRKEYGAVAADWESGAIAFVAKANATPVLILRGVSDVVTDGGSEAYGDMGAFETGARRVLGGLLDQLPLWLERWGRRPQALHSPSKVSRRNSDSSPRSTKSAGTASSGVIRSRSASASLTWSTSTRRKKATADSLGAALAA
jgi:adenosylhomocysteine nucleosidase